MKKLLMAAVAVSGLATTPAFAAPVSVDYTFNGAVTTACSITAASATFATSLSTGGTYNGAQAITADDATAFCNQAGTTVDVTHTALTYQGTFTATPGFTGSLEYTPSISTDNGGPAFSGNASGHVFGAFSGLHVTATTPATVPGGDKLIAGNYQGKITVTLNPAT